MEIFHQDFIGRAFQLSCIQAVKSTLKGFLPWKHSVNGPDFRLPACSKRSNQGSIKAGLDPSETTDRMNLLQEERG